MSDDWQDYVDDPHAAPWGMRHGWVILALLFVGVPAALVAAYLLFPWLAAAVLVFIITSSWTWSASDAIRRRRRQLRTYRRWTHHCVTCGYSLTGNLSGICPECGAPDVRT